MKSLRRCVVSAGVVALATSWGTREAKAAGFANTQIGGEQGNVVATNPTALYYNPAGMAFAKGSQLGLYGGLAIRHATYYRPGASTDTPEPAGAQGADTGEAHLLNVFGGPSIAGTLKIGNLVLGGGFFAPFYGRAHWGQNDSFINNSKFPLAAAGVQRWFSIDGATSVLYFTAGAAYRFGPLSIGATGNFISTTVNSTNAKNPLGTGLPDDTAEGRAFLDAHTFNGSFAVGLMLEAVPDQLWIGASYQAQPGLGQQTLKGNLQISSATHGGGEYSVDFLQTLPDIYRAGIRWHLKHAPVEFRVFGDRTNWSSFKSQCLVLAGNPCTVGADGSDNTANGAIQFNIRRDWSDTYGGRLGLSVWTSPGVELLFGGGYETGASPDSTLAPDIPDGNNVQGTFGARFRLTESLFLTGSYTQIQYFTRNNIGKSTLFQDAQGNQVAYPTVEEDAGGIYKAWIGVFTGNLEGIF
jgi:long-chain fatty acid transport protein